jgi:hypothetical protein
MSEDKCENCRFWKRYQRYYEKGRFTDPVHGDCRRRAPAMVIEGNEAGVTHWPTTHENDWCGEHEEGES